VRRDEIDARFATLRQGVPDLWKRVRAAPEGRRGRAGGMLRGTFFEVVNCFAMGALHVSDGAYLLGVMRRVHCQCRPHFPAGTPVPSDGSVLREHK
jgi:hypothetical protein